MVDEHRIAVLVDGDNAQASLIGKIMTAVSQYGKVVLRRVYGDWSKLHSWRDVMSLYALEPIQEYRHTAGKNANDIALTVAAMDLLHEINGVTAYCIVSSDSDFTSLAIRLRRENNFVIGVGKKTTPQDFVRACDVFIHTETLEAPKVSEPNLVKVVASAPVKVAAPKAAKKPKSEAPLKPYHDPKTKVQLYDLFKAPFAIAVQEDGWAHVGQFSSELRTMHPTFSQRQFGYAKLSSLIRGHPDLFELKRKDGHAYFRIKR